MTGKALRRIGRAGRKFEFTWRYLFNLAPTLSYRVQRRSIDGEAARVLADLNRDGIAVTTVQSLSGMDSCFDLLCEEFDSLQRSMADHIEQARAEVASLDKIGKKSFIFEYLGPNPVLNPREIYARFALHGSILQIANAYLGMHTRLRYYNVWHTFKSQAQARESQLWHRDREDRYILKAFVYLCDVEEGAGPFTYAAGTHAKGQVKDHPECFTEEGVKRSTDGQMAEVVPPKNWLKGVGPKGTIIFADTHGYHKGGLARTHDRIMYTCMFTSPASESREFLRRVEPIPNPPDPALAFALAAPHPGAWLNWHPGGSSSLGLPNSENTSL